ncbi:MAG: peptidoglycan DD-metalloendopeptidase family protein [Gallionella sp.]
MSRHTMLRSAVFLLASLFAVSGYAALPESSSVPGGVAVIPLAKVVSGKDAPHAWLGALPVLVTADNDVWYAVVGLSLTTKPGSLALRVQNGGIERTVDFEVGDKAYPEQHITLKDKGKVQLSPENLVRAEREIKEIIKYKHHWHAARDTDLAFIVPAQGPFSGHFGMRRFFNGEARAPHAGLDVAVDRGTTVMASGAGTVLAVGDYFFNGNTIFLDHGNGLITMYCHLDRMDVQVGEVVAKGQPIGLSGMTGRATGPHLHWSVVLNGTMVDPELFIPATAQQ